MDGGRGEFRLRRSVILKTAVEACGSRSCFDKLSTNGFHTPHPFGEHSKIPLTLRQGSPERSRRAQDERDFGMLNWFLGSLQAKIKRKAFAWFVAGNWGAV
jgi:hypothetical protein